MLKMKEGKNYINVGKKTFPVASVLILRVIEVVFLSTERIGKNIRHGQALVAHACNPSYVGG
jgi:hypothetical protein